MRTTEEIYQALKTSVSAGGAAVAEGGDMALRLRAVAAEIFTLEAETDFVRRQCFPQSAVGEYLDAHAAMRAMARRPAARAEGTLEFYLAEEQGADVVIPAGTECADASGLGFETVEDAVISTGETVCSVAARAIEPGERGNAAAGSIVYIKYAPAAVVGVNNTAQFSGGRDAEDDESLRERVLKSYSKLPNGANVAYYEDLVSGSGDVAAVVVQPKARGLGTVDIIFTSSGGVPTQGQIELVKERLDSAREICVDIAVRAPTTHSVNVTVQLKTGDGEDFGTVKERVRAALQGYFTGEKLGKSVYKSALTALVMAVPGVENCKLTAPASDYTAAEDCLPVAGSINISEAV